MHKNRYICIEAKKRTMKEYPTGIQTFADIIKGNFYYVDKTAYVARLARKKSRYFLSRPRRFGKSLMVSTLKSYFEGRKELFEGLAISKMDVCWQPRTVFSLSFNGGNYHLEGELERVIDDMLCDLEKQYNITPNNKTQGKRLQRIIEKEYAQSGRQCVVLIDEYDKPMLDVFGTEQEEKNRATLSSLLSALKDADECLYFLFITGVTKYSQVGLFSGANQPDDISMRSEYDAICGITQDELNVTFKEGISALGETYNMSHDETISALKKKYDGYHFSEGMTDIYNPFSLIKCLDSKKFDNFWFDSASPEALVKAVSHQDSTDSVKLSLQDSMAPNEFMATKATTENLIPLLYQAGYLTIKNVDLTEPTNPFFYLDFPNEEVRTSYNTLMLNNFFPRQKGAEAWINKVKKSLSDGDTETLQLLIKSHFSAQPYQLRPKFTEEQETDALSYNPMENYFQDHIFFIFNALTSFNVIAEKSNALGRADIIVETPLYVYIFEIKRDRSAASALKQIKERDYAGAYMSDDRTVICIGIKFSSDTCLVKDWKEVRLRKGKILTP